MAILIGLILIAVGAVILRPQNQNHRLTLGASDREQLMMEIALLDEEFAMKKCSDEERRDYEERRIRLLQVIRELG